MKRASFFAVLISALCIVQGCGGRDLEPVGPDGGAAVSGCDDVPKVQGPSQECCPGHGADACGAHLFCAAFDGRAVPTCYLLGSRLPGEECLGNVQCSTQSCNLETGRCRPVLGMDCDEATGCVDSVCDEGKCVATSGLANSRCGDDSQCKDDLKCLSGRCGLPNGAACTRSTGSGSCSSRLCALYPSSDSGKCAACTTKDDCVNANGSYERCEAGRCVHTCLDDYHCAVLPSAEFPFVCDKTDGLCR